MLTGPYSSFLRLPPSCQGAARAPMVAKALSCDLVPTFSCPAGMVDAVERTLWFVTKDALTDFDGMELPDGVSKA